MPYGNPQTKMCVDVSGCPRGMYGNPQTKMCVVAIDCPTGMYGNPSNSLCVKICPNDAYKNKKTSTCTKCTTSCRQGSYLKGKACNGKGTKSPTCAKCTPQLECKENADKCSNNPDYYSKLRCLKCVSGYTRLKTGLCKKGGAPVAKRRMLAESSPAENRTSETLPPVVVEPFLQQS